MFKKLKHKKVEHKITTKEYNDALLEWHAHEFYKPLDSKKVKIFMTLFLFAIMILGLIYDSWTFALAIGVFIIVQHIVHKGDNNILNVVISKVGIKVGRRRYPYYKINDFWIVDEEHLPKILVIDVMRDVAGEIHIQLGEQSTSKVRNVLKQYVKENKKRTLSFTDHISMLLRF